tara:strand:+ start:252 stop:401 length:150 start_codon:yes stop_codon:yes gene_type:complete
MPIPTKTPLETKDEFIGRCISNLSGEYDKKQASAICYNQLSKSSSPNLI